MPIIVIDEKLRRPILPKDINTEKHFIGAFGKWEMEEAARWIVRFCQLRGLWVSFSLQDIAELYKKESPRFDEFSFLDFEGLWEGAFLMRGPPKRNRDLVTLAFVCRCFESSPASTDVPS